MSSKDVRKSGCAFEVQLDDRPTTPGNAPPECITKHKTKPLSPRDIEEKQAQADARRKVNQCFFVVGRSMELYLDALRYIDQSEDLIKPPNTYTKLSIIIKHFIWL